MERILGVGLSKAGLEATGMENKQHARYAIATIIVSVSRGCTLLAARQGDREPCPEIRSWTLMTYLNGVFRVATLHIREHQHIVSESALFGLG